MDNYKSANVHTANEACMSVCIAVKLAHMLSKSGTDGFVHMRDRRIKMILHAESYQQKKDAAYHVVNGSVCKNCGHCIGKYCYSDDFIKPVNNKYGYCHKFSCREA